MTRDSETGGPRRGWSFDRFELSLATVLDGMFVAAGFLAAMPLVLAMMPKDRASAIGDWRFYIWIACELSVTAVLCASLWAIRHAHARGGGVIEACRVIQNRARGFRGCLAVLWTLRALMSVALLGFLIRFNPWRPTTWVGWTLDFLLDAAVSFSICFFTVFALAAFGVAERRLAALWKVRVPVIALLSVAAWLA